jgi:hypothetical protein
VRPQSEDRHPNRTGGVAAAEPLPEWEYELLDREAIHQQRRDRAESLRLTQAALGVELNGDFSLVRCAHWVHTGQELPDPEGDADVGPDAARWRGAQP